MKPDNIDPRITDEIVPPKYSDVDDVPASDVSNVESPGADDERAHAPTPDSVGSGGPIESGR
jgi:hypothetical protein